MSDDPTRSCANCPSFLKPEETTAYFGKSIGAPMCARFGRVLGAPDILPVAQETMQERIASDCSAFGRERPKRPQEYLRSEVLTPSAEVMQELKDNPSTDEDKQYVHTCLNCKFLVEPTKVMEEHSWAAGACAATGRLLLQNRMSREAENCGFRKQSEVGKFPDYLESMHLIPMYAEAKAYDPSPLGQWKKRRAQGTDIDPIEYPSDLPVSAEERAIGIRAFRRIEDPNGTGNFTFLPIFDRDSFTPEEQAVIPNTGDQEHPEDYIDARDYVYSVAVEWTELDTTPALWGAPGVGKTELARHLAWLMQLPFDRFSFTRDTEVEDLIGKMVLLNGETHFQRGRLPLAWEKRRVILLDEPNAAPDSTWQRIRPITDNSRQLVLDEGGHEIVQRNDYCYLVMAMNPAWDVRNVGVAEMADADTDRLTHLKMELPPTEVERQILINSCERDGWTPSKSMLDGVMKNSDEIRALVADGSLPVTWGVRPNMKVIRHLKWFDPLTAYRRAVADVLEPMTADLILNVVRNNGEIK